MFTMPKANASGAASEVVSMRLRHDQVRQLRRYGRAVGRSVGSVAALLLEEKLREEENPLIEFRSTPEGRQPFVKGSRLKVWQVEMLARQMGHDPSAIADHLQKDRRSIAAALSYAQTYTTEIDPLVDDVMSTTESDLGSRLAGMMVDPGR